MLLKFSSENARSFRDELEFSLLATRQAEDWVVREVLWRDEGQPIRVLPVAGIFGANASGKSNLLRVMNDMREHVLHSFRRGHPGGGVPRRPFVLSNRSREAPSSFEVDLVVDGIRHTYGFTCNDKEYLEEWAFRYPRGRASLMFRRKQGKVDLGGANRTKGRAVMELLRPNALFLSTAASASHPDLTPLYDWFTRNLFLAEANTRPGRQALTTKLLESESTRDEVLALLRAADLGIVGAEKQKIDPEMKERLERAVRVLMGEEADSEMSLALNFDDVGARLVHQSSEGPVELEPFDESLGTLVWLGLIGPVIEAIANGSVFLADELDASLHPALVMQLVRLFQNPTTNPNRAQLIFNSHDATLLGDTSERLLGRDQIWFTEKLPDGGSRLYPLSDLDARRAEAVGRRYLSGRYGAVPIVSPEEFDEAMEVVARRGSP